MARRRKYRRNPANTEMLIILGAAGLGYLIWKGSRPSAAAAVPVAVPGSSPFVAQPMPNAPIATQLPAAVAAVSAGVSSAIDAFKNIFGGSTTPPIVSPPATPAPTSGLGSLG